MIEALEKYFLDSTSVRRIKYYPVGKILEVQFLNGKIYHYNDVPESVWEQAEKTTSIGSFVHSILKGYSYTLIT